MTLICRRSSVVKCGNMGCPLVLFEIYIYTRMYMCVLGYRSTLTTVTLWMFSRGCACVHMFVCVCACVCVCLRVCACVREFVTFSLCKTRMPKHLSQQLLVLQPVHVKMNTVMGWLRSVGSIKSLVSFAECCLFYRALLQMRPIL